MIGDVRVPGDPARDVKDFLKTAAPPRISGTDPTVGLQMPDDWSPASAPFIGVFDDGGQSVWPVVTVPRLRVTVWASGRTRAREIAGVCVGLLLSRPVPGVAQITDPSSILESLDDNGGFMASFTVQAKSRTIAV